MTDFQRYFITGIPWIITWIVAFWRGRWPERAGALAILIASIATPMVQSLDFTITSDPGMMIVDSLLFAVLLVIALKANRWWTMAAAGTQLILWSLDIALLMQPSVTQHLYMALVNTMSWFLLLSLVAGIVENELRRRRERKVAAGFAQAA